MDEGLSIGIAGAAVLRHPRRAAPGRLAAALLPAAARLDGAGRQRAGRHPGPVGRDLAARRAGRPVGRLVAVRPPRRPLSARRSAAFNPFLTVYAQETRMYSLMVVLSLFATAAFLHVFVYRDRRYLPVFAALLAVMLYTHSWGIFVTAGALSRSLRCSLVQSDERGPLLKDGLIAFGAGVAALPAVDADAALPGRPHRGAVAELAALRRRRPDLEVAARRRDRDGRAAAGRRLGPGRGRRSAGRPTARTRGRLRGGRAAACRRSPSPGCSRSSRRPGRRATSASRSARC